MKEKITNLLRIIALIMLVVIVIGVIIFLILYLFSSNLQPFFESNIFLILILLGVSLVFNVILWVIVHKNTPIGYFSDYNSDYKVDYKPSKKGNCFLGKHKWVKVSGAVNIGGGKFKQTLECSVCGKRKIYIN